MDEELKKEDCALLLKLLYAEAIFAVNAFTFYNGISPYNAHKGRQPPCLPDMDSRGDDREERIRMAGIQAVTRSLTAAKTGRKEKARGLRAEMRQPQSGASSSADDRVVPPAIGEELGEASHFQVGDMVDYSYSDPSRRGRGGWNGPARLRTSIPMKKP